MGSSISISSTPDARPCASGPAAGGEAAGLVSYKTSGSTLSDPTYLDVSFSHSIVQERRVNRLRRIVWACGHLHAFGCPEGVLENVWFCTLTYKPGINWEPRHISNCLKAVRKWCKRRDVPFRYVWVAELQHRGALHYHLAMWLSKRIQLPKFDEKGWWPHGMTQRVIAKDAVGYLMKYLSKISQFHKFPKGVRIHGYGGLTKQAQDICAWLNLPSHCKQRFGVGQLQTVEGRRVVRETGEVLEAMYRRAFFAGGMRLYPNGQLPERWADGPYSAIDRFVTVAGAS